MQPRELTLVDSGRSLFGSGAQVDTYRDAEGNQWTSVGGRDPQMTQTAAQIRRRQEAFAYGARLRAEQDQNPVPEVRTADEGENHGA